MCAAQAKHAFLVIVSIVSVKSPLENYFYRDCGTIFIKEGCYFPGVKTQYSVLPSQHAQRYCTLVQKECAAQFLFVFNRRYIPCTGFCYSRQPVEQIAHIVNHSSYQVIQCLYGLCAHSLFAPCRRWSAFAKGNLMLT